MTGKAASAYLSLLHIWLILYETTLRGVPEKTIQGRPIFLFLPFGTIILFSVSEYAEANHRVELIEAYREIIKENIEYDLLVLRYGRERLDEALELMLEVILSKRPYIRIAGDDFPRELSLIHI